MQGFLVRGVPPALRRDGWWLDAEPVSESLYRAAGFGHSTGTARAAGGRLANDPAPARPPKGEPR